MRHIRNFKKDRRGDAVVEATILLPIMMMIFFGLVILSFYLPTRARLQRATQVAATAIATQQSDTWLSYDQSEMKYTWAANKDDLGNVYVELISALGANFDADAAETIVENVENDGIQSRPGELKVTMDVTNFVVYKEISITATRTIPSPVDFSFVGFPKEIPITVTSTAVVQNGDEFIRNMDIAVDVAQWLDEKYNISQMFSKVTTLFNKVGDILGV